MQKLDTKTVAAGMIREVGVAVLGIVWSFSIIVECRRLAVFCASKKSDLTALGRWGPKIWVDFSADYAMMKEGLWPRLF